jgi:hypothetical protein
MRIIPRISTSGIPVFKITPVKSTIKFAVKASVPIEGTFYKWDVGRHIYLHFDSCRGWRFGR